MKTTLAVLVLGLTATSAVATVGDMATHPLYGKWTWTYGKNHCTEVYAFHDDNTSAVTSGEEVAASRFTIDERPDASGFYRMTDTVTRSNGGTGCDGTPGGTPVGDAVTIYVTFNPKRDQMLMCQDPSFSACMGPLRRVEP